MSSTTMERSRRQTPRQRRSRVKNKLVRIAVVILPLPIGFFLWQTTGVQSWAMAMLFLSGAAFCANSAMEK